MKRKFLIAVLISFMLFGFGNVSAETYDFANNEAYYSALCSSAQASKNRTVCLAYQNYVNQKVLDAQKQLNALKKDMANIAANITKYTAQLSNYQAQITQLENDIIALEKSIEASEASIVILEAEIVQREGVIETIDSSVKERMVNMQSFASLNGYIDFLMGAESFTDLIRRVEGINDITDFDKQQMDLLQSEVNLLNEDKAEVERQKEALEQNKANIEINKETMEGLKAAAATILAEFQKQEAALMALENELVADLSKTQDALKAISKALNSIAPSPGWSVPIRARFRVSAGTWYYNGTSSVHLGVDMAAPVGTNIYAVANGVVIYSSNACPTYGYLGSKCGYPGSSYGGNQVYTMVNVNDKSYAIRYIHLEAGSPIKVGTIVKPTDVVGRVGSSGNSSGPHLHIEVIYLGTNTVAYYAQRWNGDLSFGTGFSLSTRRESNGNKAPCRLRPEDVFGVSYGKTYN